MSEYRFYIRKMEFPTEDTVVLELSRPAGYIDPKAGLVFNFKSGQYIMLQYRDEYGRLTDKHAFSIASSPTQRDHLKLGIRIGGKFTRGLTRMKIGDELIVSGPYGKFVFNEKKHKDLVLIAGGIGITPFLSAMHYATAKELPNKLSLLYSNKSLPGTLFYDEIKQLEAVNANLRALFFATERSDVPMPEGVLNKRITAGSMEDFVGRTSGKDFFICGPSPFMAAMKRNLEILGVQKNQIHMEEFAMIQNFQLPVAFKNAAYAVSLSGALMLLPLYLMFNTGNALANGSAGSGSIFSESSPYNAENIYRISKEKYDKIPKPVRIVYRQPVIVQKPTSTSPTSTLAVEKTSKKVAAKSKIAAVKGVKTVKAAAKPVVVKKTTVATKNTKSVAVATPKPKTEVSPTILAEQEAAARAAQNNQTAQSTQTNTSPTPSPVTAASATHTTTQTTASQSTSGQTSQSVATTQTTASNPTPTTHTSTPASSGTTSGSTTGSTSGSTSGSATSGSQLPMPSTQPATNPTPTTHTSTPASSGTTSGSTTGSTSGTTNPTSGGTTATAPAPTPTPTPVTSASGSTSGSTAGSGSSSGGTTISPTPTPAPTPTPTPEPRRHHDDDHEEDDD